MAPEPKATSASSNRSRGKRDPVFVTIGTLKYGFQASARSASSRTILGHQVYTGQEAVLFGCNVPKPNRATQENTQGNISSFIDGGKEEEARKAGWIITRSGVRSRGIQATAKSVPVYVPMPNGWNYAWRMDKTDFNAYGGELGIKQLTATVPNVAWGVQNPKPPKARKRINGSMNGTFCAGTTAALTKAEAAGWTIYGLNFDAFAEAT